MDLKILLKKFFPTISIVVIILCLSLMRVSPRSDMPEVPFGCLLYTSDAADE